LSLGENIYRNAYGFLSIMFLWWVPGAGKIRLGRVLRVISARIEDSLDVMRVDAILGLFPANEISMKEGAIS
jgi:hypothetical protein